MNRTQLSNLDAKEAINFNRKAKDKFSKVGADTFEEYQAGLKCLWRTLTLQEFLLKNDLGVDKDAVSNCLKCIQGYSELHDKNAEFIDSIIMCLLEAVVTSCKSESKRVRHTVIRLEISLRQS